MGVSVREEEGEEGVVRIGQVKVDVRGHSEA
jgi:hypothetical protein